jgi:hypothetical protein
VKLRLYRVGPGAQVISSGVPVPAGVLADPSTVRLSAGGQPVAVNAQVLLREHGKDGAPQGVRALLLQLPASVMTGDDLELDLAWKGSGGAPPGTQIVPFSSAGVSVPSPEIVRTAARTIAVQDGMNKLVEMPTQERTLFEGREPLVEVIFRPATSPPPASSATWAPRSTPAIRAWPG